MPHRDARENDEAHSTDVVVDSEDNNSQHQADDQPLVSFGLITDIQYADVDNGSSYDKKYTRYYRNSLNLVNEAVKHWRAHEHKYNQKMKFLLQLGDLIDGKCKSINESLPAMHRVLDELNKLFTGADDLDTPRLLNIWGNHEFYNFKRKDLLHLPLNTAKKLGQNLNSNANYYALDVTDRLRLICLDFYDYSVLGYDNDDPVYQDAMEYLKSHNKNSDLNSAEGMRGHGARYTAFNGSLGATQLEWLEKELGACKANDKKALVCGHLPLHPQAADSMCLAWNNKTILELFWSFENTVVAYMCGHDHRGGYFRDKKNIHHITMAAIIETAPNSNAFATVKVYSDRISFEGVGIIGYYDIYF